MKILICLPPSIVMSESISLHSQFFRHEPNFMQRSRTVPSFKLIALTLSAIRRDLFSGSFGFKAPCG